MRKLLLKYKNWSKRETEHHMYRYTPDLYRYMLAQNDQNLTCTGTCSRCTGTCHRKMPRMCVFLPFFHIFHLIQLYTSYTHQNHFIFILKSLFYSNPLSLLIFFQKSIMNYSQTNYNIDPNPYITLTCRLVRVYSKP